MPKTNHEIHKGRLPKNQERFFKRQHKKALREQQQLRNLEPVNNTFFRKKPENAQELFIYLVYALGAFTGLLKSIEGFLLLAKITHQMIANYKIGVGAAAEPLTFHADETDAATSHYSTNTSTTLTKKSVNTTSSTSAPVKNGENKFVAAITKEMITNRIFTDKSIVNRRAIVSNPQSLNTLISTVVDVIVKMKQTNPNDLSLVFLTDLEIQLIPFINEMGSGVSKYRPNYHTIMLAIMESNPITVIKSDETVPDFFAEYLERTLEHEMHHGAVAVTKSDERCAPHMQKGNDHDLLYPEATTEIDKEIKRGYAFITSNLSKLLSKRDSQSLNVNEADTLLRLEKAVKNYKPSWHFRILEKSDADKVNEIISKLQKQNAYQFSDEYGSFYVHTIYEFSEYYVIAGHLVANYKDKLSALVADTNDDRNRFKTGGYYETYYQQFNLTPDSTKNSLIGEKDAFTYEMGEKVRYLFFSGVQKIHQATMEKSKCAVAREVAGTTKPSI